MKLFQTFTIYKIIENSLPVILNKQKPLPLGRWQFGKNELKSFYANMDHCGDIICGSPQILKNLYPRQFK